MSSTFHQVIVLVSLPHSWGLYSWTGIACTEFRQNTVDPTAMAEERRKMWLFIARTHVCYWPSQACIKIICLKYGKWTCLSIVRTQHATNLLFKSKFEPILLYYIRKFKILLVATCQGPSTQNQGCGCDWKVFNCFLKYLFFKNN